MGDFMAQLQRQVTRVETVEVPNCCVCNGAVAYTGADEVAALLGVAKPMCTPCQTIVVNVATKQFNAAKPQFGRFVQQVQAARA